MQEENKIEFSTNRDVTAIYHYDEGYKWLLLARNGSVIDPLVYCAFEFRLALERVAFELLAQIRGSNFDTSDLNSSNKIKNIQNRIYHLEGNQLRLDRKLLFLRILIEQAGYKNFPIAAIKLSLLKKHWEFCSRYCHLQLNLNHTWGDTAFVERCVDGLKKIEIFLKQILDNLILWPQWTDDHWINDLLNKFVESDFDDTNLKTELAKRGVWGKLIGPDGKTVFLSDLYKKHSSG